MKKLINYRFLLLLALLALTGACNDDDTASMNATAQQVSDYTDSRDGHVYRCVQIGDQIWMMDNLAYHLEEGSYGGCFTWDETAFILSEVKLPNEVFCEIYNSLFNNPEYNWDVLQTNPKMPAGVKNYAAYIQQGLYTPERVLSMVIRYTVFNQILNEKLDETKPQYLGPTAQAFFEASEQENGEYSKKYGLLYSLDAARQAVPKVDGWRLPTDKDWQKLEASLGMPVSEIGAMNAWRGNGCGDFLKERGGMALFEAKMAGCNAWSNSGYQYISLQESAYFWTDEEWETVSTDDKTESGDNGETGGEAMESVREGIVRQLSLYSPMIWRGTTRINNKYRPVCYSVRCVKDAK